MKTYNAALQAQLDAYLSEQSGLPQSKAAAMIGVSPTALSQYRNSKYPGDVEAVESKIEEFLRTRSAAAQAEAEKAPYLSAGYVPTSVSEDVYKAIQYCQLERGIVVLHGDAGIGKTRGAARFVQDNPANAIYIRCTPVGGTLTAMLRQLGTALKLPATRNRLELSMAIHDRLKGTDKVIIIDEAQNLRFDALEELRSLSDPDDLTGESGTGICLIGNSEVYSRMLGKQEAQFAQQFSRVRFRRRYSTADVKLADVEKLFPTLADGSHGKELAFMTGVCRSKWGICEESPKQQVFEYIAKGALDPLFRAKLLPIQYGSLPGKGQIKGKRQNERILRRALHHKTDAAKCDVRKAYPSTTVECVMTLLRRDIGKNKVLLWLVEAIMANYPDGVLLIGGYLPCWLFNYVMSYVLRYILSHRKVRRDKSLKMVLAITCYADDITVYGRISNLEKVMRDTTRWAKETLGLTIKSAWQIVHFASFVQERQQRNRRRKGSRQRTPGLDMMGYVVRRTYTIIRGRNFVRLRRAILRAQRNLDTLGYVPWWRAQRILSQWGEIKHSDSRGFCTKYNVYKLIKAAKRSASWRGKQLHKLRLEAA